jgi:serine/threonine protein phosphatase PrpC
VTCSHTPAKVARAARAAGASVCGVTHVRAGLPNQDALAVWEGSDTERGCVIAAVADGHGGARHFRSAQGAQFAVNAATQAMARAAAEWDISGPERQTQIAATELPAAIVGAWVRQVRQHLDSAPITDTEWSTLESALGAEARKGVAAEPTLAYGATLIAALVTSRQILLLQVGDGDALLVRPDGSAWHPIPGDNRLTGEFTTSICRPGAQNDFRFCIVPIDDPGASLLLLATDGYSNSFRTDADFLQVGTDLLQMVRQHGVTEVEKQLPRILEHASVNGSGDDITLALVHLAERGQHAPATTVRPSELRLELANLKHQFQRFRTAASIAAVVALAALTWAFRGQLEALPRARPMVQTIPGKHKPGEVSDPGSAATPPSGVVSISARHSQQAIKVNASVTLTGAAQVQCSTLETLSAPGFPSLGSASQQLDQSVADGQPIQLKPVTFTAPKDPKQHKAFQGPDAKVSIELSCAGKAIASATARIET